MDNMFTNKLRHLNSDEAYKQLIPKRNAKPVLIENKFTKRLNSLFVIK